MESNASDKRLLQGIGIFALIVLGGIAFSRCGPDKLEESRQKVIEDLNLPAKEQASKYEGFGKFFDLIRKTDPKAELFSDIKLEGDKVILVTTPLWDSQSYRSRLQNVQTMWKGWASFHPSKSMDKAPLQLVDFTGLEVGGTSPLRGAWVVEQ